MENLPRGLRLIGSLLLVSLGLLLAGPLDAPLVAALCASSSKIAPLPISLPPFSGVTVGPSKP